MTRWFVTISVAFLACACQAQARCQPNTVVRLASTARQIDAALLRVEEGDGETDIPKTVRLQIARFKEALAAVVDEGIVCAPVTASATSLQTSLAAVLHANRPERPFDRATEREDYGYGANLKISVATPRNAPQLRMVTATFGIECGDDSVLLLYESKQSGWHRIMRWQSKPYSEVSGAIGDFVLYAVIAPQDSRPTRIVVAHGTPWCTSRFSDFKIDLLEPDQMGDSPKTLWHTERSYSRGDGGSRLRATNDGFELRLNRPAMDIDTFEIPTVYRYRLIGDQFKRVEPIATNGRGFIEEWLQMPWEEARDQANPAAVADLKPTYDQFAARTKETAKSFQSHTDGPVRACQGGGREFQVEIRTTLETFVEGVPGGRTESQPSTYFRIRETGDGYEMESTSHRPDPACNGPDLMPSKR